MASKNKQENNEIYAWTIESFREKEWINGNGKGLFKVGDTCRGVKARIKKSMVNLPEQITFKYWEAKFADGTGCFRDYDVHRILKRSFRSRKVKAEGDHNSEWYECTLEQVEQAVLAASQKKEIVGHASKNFKMRREQEDAVNITADYFNRFPGETKHFLWNAKMRFGKTFAAYQLAKKMGWKKIFVLTFKPAAKSAWEEDLYDHLDFEDWRFVTNESNNNPSTEFIELEKRDPEKPIVWFASFQDMLGKDKDGNVKAHNRAAHETTWDCVILDEYHFGAWRDSAKELFAAEGKAESEALGDYGENFDEKQLKSKHFLYLSGTPFRAIAESEFEDDQIFNWTYQDEQKRKEENKNDPASPYNELPEMKFYLYQMSEQFRQVATDPELNGFDLNEFFRAAESKEEKGSFKFAHAEQVQAWLDQVFHKQPSDPRLLKDFLKTQPISPFGNPELKDQLRHTVWFLPSVAACKAMGQMLKDKYHYGDTPYTVVVCAGSEAGIGADALIPLRRAMGNPEKTATITLTCGKLTTGVTIPPWNGILMLRNTASPETYFQAAFRIQSPWTVKDEHDQTKKIIKKKVCYVFDYAPDRALTEIAEYAVKLANNVHGDPIEQIKEFINYLPVLMDDGSQMCGLDAKSIFLLTTQGGSQSLLARRWASKRLVSIGESNMALLLGNKKLTELLKGIKDIDGSGNKLTEILNNAEVLKKLKKKLKEREKAKNNNQQIPDHDAELQKLQEAYQKKLRRIVSILPVFMYLTDPIEKSLEDLVSLEDKELFKKVLKIDKSVLCQLLDMKLLDAGLISYRIAGFAETDYQSMGYTGINKHEVAPDGNHD